MANIRFSSKFTVAALATVAVGLRFHDLTHKVAGMKLLGFAGTLPSGAALQDWQQYLANLGYTSKLGPVTEGTFASAEIGRAHV